MGILNFTIRSQDLDFSVDAVASDGRQAQKTIKLQDTYKMKYLKLLHIYHNINNINISDGEGTGANTILFCQISFLNANNSVFIEMDGTKTREHAGMLCLGESVKDENECVFKDLYKVLHDGRELLFINQPFTIKLFKLTSKDPDADNTDIATYNSTGSHLIEPITIKEFQGDLAESGQFLSLTFEYQEDTKK